MNWAAAADSILRNERQRAPLMRPPLTAVIFRWRAEWHYGGIQGPFVPDDTSIVFVTKTSRAVPQELIDAVLHVQPERLKLDVDDGIDFIGRQHILRRVEQRLTILTPEQTAHAAPIMAQLKIIEVFP